MELAVMYVASFGADQFNLGHTAVKVLIVFFICWWISGQAREGSENSSSASQPSSRSSAARRASESSGGSWMPSARRYWRKAGVRGISTDLGVLLPCLEGGLACVKDKRVV